MNKHKTLQKVFGIPSFRDKQEEAIDSLLDGKNTLCLMPTGIGKSLIYQFTAVAKGKMAIVFSPLIALMGQQTDNLNTYLSSINKTSFAFNSKINSIKQYKYLRDEFNPPNNPLFLFLSPEKVLIDGYLEYVLRKHKEKIGLIVIDEAHCVSQWGDSFRPAYKMLPELFTKIFGTNIPTILCLTATISNQDKKEIIQEFNIENVIKSDSLYRDNIELTIIDQFKKNADKKDELEKILRKHKNEKVIVYTHMKKRDYGTRAMSEYFKEKGFACAPFDSDLEGAIKEDALTDFINGKLKVIFATNAFGMGIDIPDIRCVVHYLIPETLEQYYQEVGRAGRDGKPANAYLLHAEPNARIKKDQINSERVNKEILENAWLELLGRKGVKDIPYIGQFDVFDNEGNNLRLKLFLSLVKRKNVAILGRSLEKINCFVEVLETTVLTKYEKSTNIGALKLISMRTGDNLETISYNVFELYDTKKIKLVSTPKKTLYYQVNKALTEQDIQELETEFNTIVDFKLEGLSKLKEVLDNEISIQDALNLYLGI